MAPSATSPLSIQVILPRLRDMRPEYIVELPGGGVMDTRYVYARADCVRITQGPYAGRRATVESRQARWVEHGVIHQEPGYDVVLDDGAGATVRWDWLGRM